MIELSRSLCSDEAIACQREWLVTNGMGGYASGTVAGVLSRRYHGLLIAALDPPLGRTLMVSKVDETLEYGQDLVEIYANAWAGGQTAPRGFEHLDHFYLEGTTPVWVYAIHDALIEKRVWMEQGANTTYVRYNVLRGDAPILLKARVLVNYRDHHGITTNSDWSMDITPAKHGVQVRAFEGAQPFFIQGSGTSIVADHVWYQHYQLAVEAYRGLEDQENHLLVARISAELKASAPVTLVFTVDAEAPLDGEAAYERQKTHEKKLLSKAHLKGQPLPIRQLTLAADQFIVSRRLPDGGDGHSVIAGYPWFGDWGRDTMIALPGLTLQTGRPEIARSILQTFAEYVDGGMLPNRFPDGASEPEYNTVDATFWFVEAIRAYVAWTGDRKLLRGLFPVLEQIVDSHLEGTRYNIHIDPEDRLVYAGEAGVQLTWMDAKVGDRVVTPRIGKPVEINALWYHALKCMAKFAALLDKKSDRYDALASQVKQSFKRFWNKEAGYCYDVLDGPDGDDLSLRPNQLFAVSLVHSALSKSKRKHVVDVCSRHLLTPYGMRTLAPAEAGYQGRYGGSREQRDGAYHQGTSWAWLIGAFISAHYAVYKDARAARFFLRPLLSNLNMDCVGSVSEIFDGDPPYAPRGAFAQAWSVAEILRVWGTAV